MTVGMQTDMEGSMKYRIKEQYMYNGVTRYIPQVHIFWIFWANILNDERVTGSIFFPENMDIDKAVSICRSKRCAEKAIEAHKAYDRCTNSRVVVEEKIIEQN